MKQYMDGLLKKLELYQLPYIVDVGLVVLGSSAGKLRALVKVNPEKDPSTSISLERICDLDFEYSIVDMIWAWMIVALFAHTHWKFVGIRDRLRRCAAGDVAGGLANFSEDRYLGVGVILYAPWVLGCWIKCSGNVWEFLEAFLVEDVYQTVNFWNQFFMAYTFFVIQMATIMHGMHLVLKDFVFAITVGEALGRKYWAFKKILEPREIPE